MGAEEADGIELDTVEFQGPGGGQFTIGENDEDEEDDERPTGLGEGKIDGQGSLGAAYSMANFEPQRHTDLT